MAEGFLKWDRKSLLQKKKMSEATEDDNVVFDVGGNIYKFPRSLLSIYPDTMLAKLVSK